MMRETHSKIAALMLTIFFVTYLSSCAVDDIYAPVVYPGSLSNGYYVVQKGDTLYSIAFRFGLDFKQVAKINNIKAPYIIHIRQKIRIKGVSADRTTDSAPIEPDRSVSVSKNNPSSKPAIATPVQAYTGKSNLRWIWPLKGQVAKKFALSGDINKGIDIEGKPGQSVVAAEDGMVVYAGGGLRGYGKLVIVKHNDRYLSAYGNNEKLMVKEGQSVKAGDKISRIGPRAGQGKKDSAELHFEIRRDGKPQNPIRLLPPLNSTSAAD